MIKPQPLKKGDAVGVVSPAGLYNEDLIRKGIELLKSMGFRVKLYRENIKPFRYMAGSDEERADEFMSAFLDEEIRGIFASRGGYGSIRIIPYLKPEIIKTHPKVFVGYSDITSLHLFLLNRCGMICFYGPMIAQERSISPEELELLLDLIMGNMREGLLGVGEPLKGGKAEGRLTGGCLSLIVSSISTGIDAPFDGKILFLEDVGEPAYRIDRMLTQLKMAGRFHGVKGVVFGSMKECGSQKLIKEIVLDIFDEGDFPVIFNFPSGHGEKILTLPLGAEVLMDGDSGALWLLEGAVQ